MQDSPAPWGQHLILDFAGCPPNLLKSAQHIRDWVAELVAAIDMKSYGAPIIEHFATHSFEAAGFTLLQLIETSNICAHFAENIGQVYIDIFSCKAFDVATAETVCRRYFEPQLVSCSSLQRGIFQAPMAVAS